MMSGNVCLVVQNQVLNKCTPREIRNGLFYLPNQYTLYINVFFKLSSPVGGSYTSDVQPSPSHSIEGPTDMSYIHCKFSFN